MAETEENNKNTPEVRIIQNGPMILEGKLQLQGFIG